MSHDRAAANAITIGTIASLVTMALHPTGADVVREAEAGGHNALVRGVHLLAVAAQPLLLAGTARLSWRLRTQPAAWLGLTSFALAALAVTIAAAASGLIAPHVAESLAEANATQREWYLELLHYTATINRAFAEIYVLLLGVALLGWGWAMRAGSEFRHGLAWLGLILGVAAVAIGGTGLLPLDIHGFGAVVLGQAVWMLWMGRALLRPA